MEHTEEHAQVQKTFMWWLWHGFFVLVYPVLVTFALLYTTLLWIFSTLSRIISWVIKLFSGQKRPQNHHSEQSVD